MSLRVLNCHRLRASLAGAVLLASLAAPSAHAANTPFDFTGLPLSPQSIESLPDQCALTAGDVARTLGTYPALRAFAHAHAASWRDFRLEADAADPIGTIRTKLRADGSMAELERILKPFGFRGFDDFARIAFSVLAAFGFDKTPLAAAKALPPLTRQLVFVKMPELRRIYNKLDPPDTNVNVVAPFAAQIQTILDTH